MLPNDIPAPGVTHNEQSLRVLGKSKILAVLLDSQFPSWKQIFGQSYSPTILNFREIEAETTHEITRKWGEYWYTPAHVIPLFLALRAGVFREAIPTQTRLDIINSLILGGWQLGNAADLSVIEDKFPAIFATRQTFPPHANALIKTREFLLPVAQFGIDLATQHPTPLGQKEPAIAVQVKNDNWLYLASQSAYRIGQKQGFSKSLIGSLIVSGFLAENYPKEKIGDFALSLFDAGRTLRQISQSLEAFHKFVQS